MFKTDPLLCGHSLGPSAVAWLAPLTTAPWPLLPHSLCSPGVSREQDSTCLHFVLSHWLPTSLALTNSGVQHPLLTCSGSQNLPPLAPQSHLGPPPAPFTAGSTRPALLAHQARFSQHLIRELLGQTSLSGPQTRFKQIKLERRETAVFIHLEVWRQRKRSGGRHPPILLAL